VQATPSAPALRPLGVGDVLDRTFGVYRQRPLLFIGLSAVWYLVLVIVIAVLAVAAFASAIGAFVQRASPTVDPATLATAAVGFIAFAIVAFLLVILLFSAQSASLVRAAALRYLGKDATIGEAFGTGLRASPRVFLAGVIVFLLLILFWAAVFIAGALIAAVAQGGAVAFLAIFLGVIVAIVGTFYLGASWLVAPVIVVVEGLGPIAALSRSWGLSAGNRWRIIGIQLLLLILNLVLSLLIASVFAVVASQRSPAGLVVQNLVQLASTIIWAPVEWLAFTVLYYDLRVRKEAFDLQLAAEALPQS
jgi:hypothetical protein